MLVICPALRALMCLIGVLSAPDFLPSVFTLSHAGTPPASPRMQGEKLNNKKEVRDSGMCPSVGSSAHQRPSMVDGVREGPTRSSLDLTHLCPGTASALGPVSYRWIWGKSLDSGMRVPAHFSVLRVLVQNFF